MILKVLSIFVLTYRLTTRNNSALFLFARMQFLFGYFVIDEKVSQGKLGWASVRLRKRIQER